MEVERGGRARQPERHQEVRLVRVQPPARPRLPGEDPEHLRPERARHRPEQHHRRRAAVPQPGRRRGLDRDGRGARAQAPGAQAHDPAAAGDADRAERQRRRGLGRRTRATCSGRRATSTVTPANGQPANAPNWNYFHSKVYYDPARAANGKVAAQQVSKLIGSADVEPLPAQLRALANGALLTVIVGSTFHGAAHAGRDPDRADAAAARRCAATRRRRARRCSSCASGCRSRSSTRRSSRAPPTWTPATARRRSGSIRSATSRRCG